MCDETFWHRSGEDGRRFVDILRAKGILVGITVDRGLAPIPGSDGEEYTQGLDDLPARCTKYYLEGARFAKWCVVNHSLSCSDFNKESRV